MSIAVHPSATGQPHRIRGLDTRAITSARTRARLATGQETVADYQRSEFARLEQAQRTAR